MTDINVIMAAARRDQVKANPAGLCWYLARNLNMSQERARECLRRTGYEFYDPKERLMKPVARRHLSHSERKSGIAKFTEAEVQLWPRYLLVRYDLEDGRWHDLFAGIGIQGVLGDPGSLLPSRFPDRVIDAMRGLEVNGALPATTKIREIVFAAGDVVRVTEGPFTGFDVEIAEILDREIGSLDESARVKLLVALFGRITPVELPITSIRRLEKPRGAPR